jgi:hypothetical protein
MVLRSKAQIGALLILAFVGPVIASEPLVFQVRHRHVRQGAEGTLRVTDDGIAFEEGGKHKDHSRRWQFEDIEQLTLGCGVLRILTYETKRLNLGGDREFVFDNLPEDFAAQLYPSFSRRLDQRFVAAIADNEITGIWEAPAKLLHWRGGSQGRIILGPDHVVFQAESPEQSRTWRVNDIDLVSSSGPFDLTITTFERSGASYAAHKDFHFTLKQPLSEAEYNALWARVNQAKGLTILNYNQGERQ